MSIARKPQDKSEDDVQVGMTISELEIKLIVKTLAHCDGNKERSAQMLGVSVKTLYNKLKSKTEAN